MRRSPYTDIQTIPILAVFLSSQRRSNFVF
jgi:hypothetical protein